MTPIRSPTNTTNLQSIFKFKVNLPAGQHDRYTLYIKPSGLTYYLLLITYDRYTLYIKPSGLTMANPSIYLKADEQNTKLVADLRAHFVRIHELSGLTTAQVRLWHTLVCAAAKGPHKRARQPTKEPGKRGLLTCNGCAREPVTASNR
jgi:hypothetical protein